MLTRREKEISVGEKQARKKAFGDFCLFAHFSLTLHHLLLWNSNFCEPHLAFALSARGLWTVLILVLLGEGLIILFLIQT